MNKTFQLFCNSFRFKKDFWITLGIEALFFLLILGLFLGFGTYFSARSAVIMQGHTVEEIQQALIDNPGSMLPLLTELKNFLLIAIIIVLLLTLFTFFGFSWTQAYNWNYLLKKKLDKKHYWRWNALNIALIVPLLIYGLCALIIKLITSLIFKFILTLSPTFYTNHFDLIDSLSTLLNGMISFLLILILLLFIILVYFQFTEKYKVWVSFGEAFHSFKIHWSKIWKMTLLALGIALILSLFSLILNYLNFAEWFLTLIKLIIGLLYVAWLRYYLLKLLEEK